MSGLLVQLDMQLRQDIVDDGALRAGYSRSGDLFLQDATVVALAQNGGIPQNLRQFIRMPVLCTNCGMFASLHDAVEANLGPRQGVCPQCDQIYWDREFPDALRAMVRIDWRHAFDALLERQGNMLVRPMLKPMYQPDGHPDNAQQKKIRAAVLRRQNIALTPEDLLK